MAQVDSTRNFAKMSTCGAKRSKYAFVDSSEHRADRILIGALIPVSFERQGRKRTDGRYELRICSFDSKYETWFLNCMADLEWVIEGDDLVAGGMLYEDGDDPSAYARACRALLEVVAAA